MPNWTDEDGFNWFNKLRCKRCESIFEAVDGEVPVHKCLDEYCKSVSGLRYPFYHTVVKASQEEINKFLFSNKRSK